MVGTVPEDDLMPDGTRIGHRADVLRSVERMMDPHRHGQRPGHEMRNHMREFVIFGQGVADFVEPDPVQGLPLLLRHALRIRKELPQRRLLALRELLGQLAGRQRAQSNHVGDTRHRQQLRGVQQ
ncbi:hypothetical protein [Micromonospora fulviviridis]|uniref:hypothetical protein n=1 Tax=Micromonospora fulviviridis TaxID=47860 RepID=UPI00379CBFEE